MKTIIITTIVALMSITAIHAQRDSYEVQVDGLGCPFCAYGLEKKFKEFKGIKDVAIEIETGDFTFTYPSDKALTLEAVEKQVEKAGYTPITTKITRADGTVETSGGNAKVAINQDEAMTSEIYVYGNCAMCEARIEKATKGIPGVVSASWDADTKMLNVNYDASLTSKMDIEKKMASVGHSTKSVKTDDATYNDLPACCQYKRSK